MAMPLDQLRTKVSFKPAKYRPSSLHPLVRSLKGRGTMEEEEEATNTLISGGAAVTTRSFSFSRRWLLTPGT